MTNELLPPSRNLGLLSAWAPETAGGRKAELVLLFDPRECVQAAIACLHE